MIRLETVLAMAIAVIGSSATYAGITSGDFRLAGWFGLITLLGGVAAFRAWQNADRLDIAANQMCQVLARLNSSDPEIRQSNRVPEILERGLDYLFSHKKSQRLKADAYERLKGSQQRWSR